MSTETQSRPAPTAVASRRSPVFSALIGLCALAVLLQGVWAGIFLEHDGKRNDSASWINAHARGADVAIVLAIAATAWALVKMRSRKDLWIGSGLLTTLLVAESSIGGLMRDQGKDTLTAVHVPLGMALMGLVVWLPLRARRPFPER